jgi:hypothetical protein
MRYGYSDSPFLAPPKNYVPEMSVFFRAGVRTGPKVRAIFVLGLHQEWRCRFCKPLAVCLFRVGQCHLLCGPSEQRHELIDGGAILCGARGGLYGRNACSWRAAITSRLMALSSAKKVRMSLMKALATAGGSSIGLRGMPPT